MVVIGFHGFGATPNRSRFCSTIKSFYALKGIPVYCPKYNYLTKNPLHDFKQLDQHIQNTLEKSNNIIFYGISLGGFVARYFSLKYDQPMVLFNPSIKPWNDIDVYFEKLPCVQKLLLNGLYFNRVKSSANKCREFYYEKHHNKQTIVLSQDDDIIDWNFAYDYFNGKANMIIHETGGHTFEKSIPLLNRTLAQIDETFEYDKNNKEEKDNQKEK